MSNAFPFPCDVVIAGAGPVGLFLACELRLAGVSVTVIEQAHDPESPLKRLPFGMRGLSSPTLEAFHRRRLLDALVAPTNADPGSGGPASNAVHWQQQTRRPAGHFAGIQFFDDAIDTAKWAYRLPGSRRHPPGDRHGASGSRPDRTRPDPGRRDQARTCRGRCRRVGRRRHGARRGRDPARALARRMRRRTQRGAQGCRASSSKAPTPSSPDIPSRSRSRSRTALVPGRHYTPTGMYSYAPPGTIAMVDFRRRRLPSTRTRRRSSTCRRCCVE